jgi:Calcineurin-like phosphoesterase
VKPAAAPLDSALGGHFSRARGDGKSICGYDARVLRPFVPFVLGVACLAACERKVQEAESRAESAQSTSPPVAALSPRLSRPAPARLVAIGDLHGDLDHTRRALRLAGAIDEHDHWIGGALVVVQTGDEVDRGDDDRTILDLVDSLSKQAAAAGGAIVPLLGNHEIMNALLDFRYATPGGLAAFSLFDAPDAAAPAAQVPASARGRAAAFEPGGVYARLFSGRAFVAKVGDTVFVHGGILPKHVAYGLDRMNDEIDEWLAGRRAAPPAALVAEDGPVWTRAYSSEDAPADCEDLKTALRELGAARMVVGHTVQHRGINSACDAGVWRIDVGLSRYFGGPIEVLQIQGADVTVLRETRKD